MAHEPMSPAEFDRKCRTLMARCPWLSEGSGHRSRRHNARVNGHPASKHLLGMARDFSAMEERDLEPALVVARELGFWCKIGNKGSGIHIHAQGLPKGPVDPAWLARYGPEAMKEDSMSQVQRQPESKAAGALEKGGTGSIAVAIGAYVTTQTGSPELGMAAGGAFVAVTNWLASVIRDAVMEKR